MNIKRYVCENISEDIWIDIKNYEGLYQVNQNGVVKALNYRGLGFEFPLQPSYTQDGYALVHFSKGNQRETFLVHRLVAEAFLHKENDLLEVNHIDEDKTNNAVWNLEWCTHKYNMNYGTRVERRRETIKRKNTLN